MIHIRPKTHQQRLEDALEYLIDALDADAENYEEDDKLLGATIIHQNRSLIKEVGEILQPDLDAHGVRKLIKGEL